MRNANRTRSVMLGCVLLTSAASVWAQDWPQWRGPNRDNKAVGFTAPATWPKTLTQKWKVTVGAGDSSPVLVGDRVYVFSRQGGDEVTTCLDAASGKQLWQDRYATQPADPPAGGIHAGPRSTPAVAEGKVCTFGVRGVLSCLDAATGKLVWRKDSKAWPQFFTASSPIIVDGKCIAYLGGGGGGKGKFGGKGGGGKGEIVAYDLASGEAKWKWTGEGPSYGSPNLMTADGTKQLVTLTASSIVGIGLADGKQLWQVPFKAKYNNGTPIIDGQTLFCSSAGAGTVAYKIEKKGDKFEANELWRSKQAAHQYNTPVLKDGVLFGLSTGSNFFCMDAKTGNVLWTDKTSRGQCGTVIDAGAVLLALSSDTHLVAFLPSGKEYKEVAQFKVADTATWAYPIISGNRVFVKDQNTLTLWTIE